MCEELHDLEYVVYILRSESDPTKMYCGSTNNIRRRLRQHNGHIKGGGQYTSENRPWRLAVLIPIGKGKKEALQVEFLLKVKNYPREIQEVIPEGLIERRLFTLRFSTQKYGIPFDTVLFFDPDFQS